MASVHIEVRDAARRDAAAQNPSASPWSTLKLIALWLAVLVPLAYGVFEQWQDAKALFGR